VTRRGDHDPRRLRQRRRAKSIGQQVRNRDHQARSAGVGIDAALDVRIQPDGHGGQSGNERQQRFGVEQEQHRSERRQQREGADAARAGVLFALVDALEGQAHEHRHRDRQAQTTGYVDRMQHCRASSLFSPLTALSRTARAALAQ
jgi:hypothetical protein